MRCFGRKSARHRRRHGCAAPANRRLELVEDYRAERARQQAIAEEASNCYRVELDEWLADHPLPTFRQWLIWNRRVDA